MVGNEYRCIIDETERLLRDSRAYATLSKRINLYVNGMVAVRIVIGLLERRSTL